MSGIYFFGTQQLDGLREFYLEQVGCALWLEQEDCIVLRHGNMLFGFCRREIVESGGILCFFFQRREDVDTMYEAFRDTAASPPQVNENYRIYHFFATDPEGRKIEFQCFDHPVCGHLTGAELLLQRRSIRKFKTDPVPETTLAELLENCRWAPTSRNSQSYYFKIIRERDLIEEIAATREWKSAPIARAPLAVAICADPALSQRYIQDGCIAAYHLLLAAWHFDLGTCWIAAMDREDVKEWLGIPQDHYIATVTPLGFPLEPVTAIPARKEAEWFLR